MYPDSTLGRDRFILDRRSPRPEHDPWRYQGLVVEDERTAGGPIVPVATVFLTGRECAFRCVMCDLWRYTTPGDTPAGAIPAQITDARAALANRGARVAQMKLYNAGNFFDPRAVPESDYPAIADALAGFDRVIVESHPAFIGGLGAIGSKAGRTARLLDALARVTAPIQLEVAMGLETAHPAALEKLHKQMTVAEFSAAAERLKDSGVALRVFLLISPPFVPHDEQDAWLLQSIEVAFSCGATAVSLIPMRSGNGAMEALAEQGMFRPPRLEDIERSADLALASRPNGRVFVDLWDLERFSRCEHCFAQRRARLLTMNHQQRSLPLPFCPHCGCGASA